MQNGSAISTSVLEDRKIGAQHWTNLQTFVGQRKFFPKSTTQILSYTEKDRAVVIDYDFQYHTILTDVEGASSAIKHLPSIMPGKGLGFYIAVDGNQDHKFKHRLNKINHLCGAAVSMILSQKKIFYMLQTIVTLQTAYVVHLPQLNLKHTLDV